MSLVRRSAARWFLAGALLSGCAATSPGVIAHDSAPQQSASSATGCAKPDAKRTAEAYVAMLKAEQIDSPRVFVSARYSDAGAMINDATGPINADALACLQQLAPNVTIVTGSNDPALPTETGTGIRRLPAGPFITFGRLEGAKDDRTSINIDRGGGDVHGGEFTVHTEPDGHVTVLQSGPAWIS